MSDPATTGQGDREDAGSKPNASSDPKPSSPRSPQSPDDGPPVATGDASRPRRRRGSRGGRSRNSLRQLDGDATEGADPSGDDLDVSAPPPAAAGAADADGTRRRSRRTPRTGDPDPARQPELPRKLSEGRAADPDAAARALVRRPEADPAVGLGKGDPGAAGGEVTAASPAGRRPRIGDSRPAPAVGISPGPPADESDDGDDDGPRTARRRRRGRGRGRSSGGAAESTATATEAVDNGEGKSTSPAGGRSGGAGKGPSAGRGRARRGTKGSPVDAVLHEGSPVELDEEALEARRGRERKGRPVGRYLMCVHVEARREGQPEGGRVIQIAVLEGRSLIEHYVSRPADDVSQIHGNIYLGRVQNVLPGMEAAFVDIGTPKNAVLYRGDLQYDPEDVVEKGRDLRIEQLLKPRQTLVCQVTKNPIGAKGARLTQEVSLPGRFVVLIPNSSTYGISKRLSDEERKRLRTILDRVKPKQHGVIVRTAAENVTSEEIERDVLRLLKQWERIDELGKRSAAPALLYREPDMAVRVIREEFNAEYRAVVIDDEALHEEVRDYVASISPGLADRVSYYDREVEQLPVFERHHVHEQLHKALDRKVWLPSGGSLIIEHTEALTVIDVNTGKNVGVSSLEETVFKNNLEAAQEVARQLRLRDIGGIIVIDFIDMEIRQNRDQVIAAFRQALARDKTRTQVFDISELGLVEMTRKRIGEGLLESFTQRCEICAGRGIVFDRALFPDD
jgi:ribonuclease E